MAGLDTGSRRAYCLCLGTVPRSAGEALSNLTAMVTLVGLFLRVLPRRIPPH